MAHSAQTDSRNPDRHDGPVVQVTFWQLAGLIVLLLAAVFLLMFLPHLPRFSQVIACVFASLVFALAIFGVLPAAGVLRWKGLRLGGAAALGFVAMSLLLRCVEEPGLSVRGTVLLVRGSSVAPPPDGSELILVGFGRLEDTVRFDGSPDGQFVFYSIPAQTKLLRFQVRIPNCSVIERTIPFVPGEFVELRIDDPLPPLSACEIQEFQFAAYDTACDLGFYDLPALSVETRGWAEDFISRLSLEAWRRNAQPVSVPLQLCILDSWRVAPFCYQSTLDSSQVLDYIERDYGSGYGAFRLRLTVREDIEAGQEALGANRSLPFNRVYRQDFGTLEDAFDRPPSHGLRLSDMTNDSDDGGVYIRNRSRDRGFVSALLAPRFTFSAPMLVAGAFSIILPSGRQVPKEAPGVDVTFGSSPRRGEGDTFQVIMGDASLDSYCLKVKGDKVTPIRMASEIYRHLDYEYAVRNERQIGNQIRVEDRSLVVAQSIQDSELPTNHFQVRFSPSEDATRVWCELYVAAAPIDNRDPDEEQLVHKRLVRTSLFQENDLRVRVRVWRAGEVILHRIIIAQLDE